MEDSERNRWPMAKIVAVISDVKGDVCSVRMLVSAADKSENSIRYLKRPVNKLVVLVENEDGDNGFDWMVRFPYEKPSFYVSRCHCNTLRGGIG